MKCIVPNRGTCGHAICLTKHFFNFMKGKVIVLFACNFVFIENLAWASVFIQQDKVVLPCIKKHIYSKHQILPVMWIKIVIMDTVRMDNVYVLMTTTTK